jgi:hypothetical protein
MCKSVLTPLTLQPGSVERSERRRGRLSVLAPLTLRMRKSALSQWTPQPGRVGGAGQRRGRLSVLSPLTLLMRKSVLSVLTIYEDEWRPPQRAHGCAQAPSSRPRVGDIVQLRDLRRQIFYAAAF